MPTAINGSIYLTTIDRANLKLLGHGLSDKEIAVQRGVSYQTVKNEMDGLRKKFNATGRLQLALNAVKLGHIILTNSSH